MPPETTRAPIDGERLGQHAGVLHGAPHVLAEVLAQGEFEGDRLGRDDVHQWAALDAREDGLVDGLGEAALDVRVVGPIDLGRQLQAAEDEAASRPSQGLVRRGGDDVRMREGARMQAGRDEAGDVGHVDEEQGADAVGDGRHALEVDDARVGRGAGDDEPGSHASSGLLEGLVVDPGIGLTHAVGMDLVEAAGEVEGHAVGQVAAVGEVHAHDAIARLEDGEVGRHVRLGAAVRLDVDMLGAGEELQGPRLRQPFGHVHVLTAAVVALARQALGVLVGQP